MKDIILLGIGGHAHSVVSSIELARKYNIVGFLDKKEMGDRCIGAYYVLGTDNDLERYYVDGVRNAFVTIGFMGRSDIRNRLYRKLKAIGYNIPNIIDISAIVAENVKFGEGVYVGKRAVINADAKIGKMCIINTGAIVEDNCQVGAFSHISVGSVLCGNVTVGSEAFIGANATIIQGINIGDNCIIGAGMTVRKNMEERTLFNKDRNILYTGG